MSQKSISDTLPTVQDMHLLSGCFLFCGLSEGEITKALVEIRPQCASYKANEVVVEGGTPFTGLGLVCSGELSVIRRGGHRTVIHRTLHQGNFFGVSSLFGKQEGFPTTITAETAARILFLSESDITALFAKDPHIARNYITLLSDKIRFLNDRLDMVAGRSAEERVASYLLSHTGQDGSLGITKSALASLLGLGRASLYRILDAFEEQGLIKVRRDAIETLDTAAMKLLLNTERN